MAGSRNNSGDSNAKNDTSDTQSPSSSPLQETFQKVWNTVKKAADPRTERRFSIPSFLRRNSSTTPVTSPPRQGSSDQTSSVPTSPERTQPQPQANRPEAKRASSSPKGRLEARRTFSVPEFLRRFSSSQRPPSPEQEQEVRPEDEEDSKFGNTVIGLLGRNPRYRYLLCEKTQQKVDAEIAEEKVQKAKEGPRRKSIEVGVGAAEAANHSSEDHHSRR
ncbi:hypothetical protein MMC30_003284 [Trapelia coarctata]|nr:hypothetical protein [Trapelia coarctata]